MFRKLLTTLTGAAIAVTMLAGAANAADKKITFLTWNLGIYKEKYDAWIAEFHQKYPDIEVEWINKKGSEWATFYQTQVAAGTPPDVLNIQGALWAEYADAGQLLDLTPFLEGDAEFKGRFADGALDLWMQNGKPYMVPWYFNKTLLFLNKPMLEKAGITTPPKSFDELMDYAEKLKGEGKNGFLTTNFDWLYWPLFKMNGVDILNADMSKAAFNTPAGRKTLARLAAATKSGAINNISWTGRWVEPNNAFAAGNIGMYLAPNSAFFWAAGKSDWINDKTIIAVEAPTLWSTPNHHGWGVSSASKHPQAAAHFVKIATSEKWQRVMSETFSILTLNKKVDDELIARFKTENPLKAKVLSLARKNIDKMTGYLKTPKDAKVKDKFWSAVQPALLGQVDADKALADAERQVNRVLSR